jgi:hypothetical protein
MKDSFLIYNSFYEPIKLLKDNEKAELLDLMFEYNITGEIPEIKSLQVKILWATMKQQFDRDSIKYQNIVERNRINGSKGGRPEKAKQPSGLIGKPRKPQKADTVSDSDIKESISKDIQKKGGLSLSDISGSEDYKQFRVWMKDNAPYCDNPKHFSASCITEKELHKLKEKYTGKQISDKILALENSKKAQKDKKSVYLTVLNWLNRDNNGK